MSSNKPTDTISDKKTLSETIKQLKELTTAYKNLVKKTPEERAVLLRALQEQAIALQKVAYEESARLMHAPAKPGQDLEQNRADCQRAEQVLQVLKTLLNNIEDALAKIEKQRNETPTPTQNQQTTDKTRTTYTTIKQDVDKIDVDKITRETEVRNKKIQELQERRQQEIEKRTKQISQEGKQTKSGLFSAFKNLLKQETKLPTLEAGKPQQTREETDKSKKTPLP